MKLGWTQGQWNHSDDGKRLQLESMKLRLQIEVRKHEATLVETTSVKRWLNEKPKP